MIAVTHRLTPAKQGGDQQQRLQPSAPLYFERLQLSLQRGASCLDGVLQIRIIIVQLIIVRHLELLQQLHALVVYFLAAMRQAGSICIAESQPFTHRDAAADEPTCNTHKPLSIARLPFHSPWGSISSLPPSTSLCPPVLPPRCSPFPSVSTPHQPQHRPCVAAPTWASSSMCPP